LVPTFLATDALGLAPALPHSDPQLRTSNTLFSGSASLAVE